MRKLVRLRYVFPGKTLQETKQRRDEGKIWKDLESVVF